MPAIPKDVQNTVDGEALLQRIERKTARYRPFWHGVILVTALVLSRPTDLTDGLAVLIALFGVFLRFWALTHIRKDKKLATDGPYALCRHPLYLANFIIFAAVAVATNTWAMALVIAATVAVYFFTIRHEERMLLRTFGEDYANYAAGVPAIIPRFTHPGISLSRGPVPACSRWFVRAMTVIISVAAFEVKEDILEYVFRIEYDPIWVGVLHQLSHYI